MKVRGPVDDLALAALQVEGVRRLRAAARLSGRLLDCGDRKTQSREGTTSNGSELLLRQTRRHRGRLGQFFDLDYRRSYDLWPHGRAGDDLRDPQHRAAERLFGGGESLDPHAR